MMLRAEVQTLVSIMVIKSHKHVGYGAWGQVHESLEGQAHVIAVMSVMIACHLLVKGHGCMQTVHCRHACISDDSQSTVCIMPVGVFQLPEICRCGRAAMMSTSSWRHAWGASSLM